MKFLEWCYMWIVSLALCCALSLLLGALFCPLLGIPIILIIIVVCCAGSK